MIFLTLFITIPIRKRNKKNVLVNRREERMGKGLLAGRKEGEKVVGQGGKKGKGLVSGR